MKPSINRRQCLKALFWGMPAAVLAWTFWLEPRWLNVRRVRVTDGKPSLRVVHFTDLHCTGDTGWLRSIVDRINGLSPDLVCFTGDLAEDEMSARAAAAVLKDIRAPVYACPGNHDTWRITGAARSVYTALAGTGGAWLDGGKAVMRDGKTTIHGLGPHSGHPVSDPGTRNIVLLHYPGRVSRLPGRYDLILAGHTHGGQVRVPFAGPLILPHESGKYDLGLFQPPAGPLHVSAGVGWFFLRARFNCRPEIVLLEL